MAQKRSFPEASEQPSKVSKVEEARLEYLLPIEFVNNGSSPCTIQIIADLFRIKDRRNLFLCSISIGESDFQESTGDHFIVASFQDALTELIQTVERHCQLSSVTMVTKGHRGIRNSLHHEMVHAKVDQALARHPFWWKYFEIGNLSTNDTTDSTKYRLPRSLKVNTPLTNVEWMCDILEKYLNDENILGEPTTISSTYSHAIIPERALISSGTVAEIHQLPWTSTPYSIAVFFRGLNIRPGGIAIKIAEGRRSNTAYVAFESELDAQLACERTSQEDYDVLACLETASINQNNRSSSVQISMASEVLFLQCAVCRYPDIANFLQQLTDEKQIVVRIRGLPYSAKKSDIVKFFDQVEAKILNGEDGIFFATHADCRPTGDAFVLFVNNLDADKALTRHRNYLGQRYIELFKASPSEAIQVCQSAQQNGTSCCNKTSGQASKILKSQTAGLTVKDPTPTLSSCPAVSTILNSSNSLPGNLSLQDISSSLLNPFLLAPSLLTMPLTTTLPIAMELTDPTDPKSPFARPLPPGGARFVIQILDLPSTYSRQDVRLFLGMDIFVNVYRMCKITTCLTDDSWLLLFADLADAIWAVEELIKRPSTVTVLPRFFIFEIDVRDLQLNLLHANRLPQHLPPTRVLNMQMQAGSAYRRKDPQMNGLVGLETQTASTAAASMSASSFLIPQALRQLPFRMTPDNTSTSADFTNSCMLQITGLPRNVTQLELSSLYAPVMHLLSSPPQFLPLPSTAQEPTLTYIAIFANRADVALVLTHCRVSVLRGNTYFVVTTPLAVLSELRAFLAGELVLQCRLPPHVEERRQVLLEHLDLLTFGPCPSPPPPPPLPPSPPHLALSVSPQALMLQCQKRPKRHSMPLFATSSPLPRLPLHSNSGPVGLASSSSNTSDYATPCGGPSQRASFETATVTTTQSGSGVNNPALKATSPLYEEPVNFIQRLSMIRPSEKEPGPPEWSPEHRQISHPSAVTQTRLSLSSHLDSSTSSTPLSYPHLQAPTVGVGEGLPASSVYPTVFEAPVVDTTDLGTLMLPKKSSSSSRRGAAPLYTLAGALYHRHKPSKWTRLGYCVLTPDAHLLGFRSYSMNQSTSPVVSLFVAAASTVAVYAGRESGMQHVFKVTHPGNGGDTDSSSGAVSFHGGGGRALVFAADCEEEALAWINQINQYAQGITPSRVESFTEHFCRQKSSSTHCQYRRHPSDGGSDFLSLGDFSGVASTVSAVPPPRRQNVVALGGPSGRRLESQSVRPHSLFLPRQTPLTLVEQKAPPTLPIPPLPPNEFEANQQEDSGFSGLISSSSSATDGVNGEVTEQRGHPTSTSPNSSILRHQRYSIASTASPSISTYDLLQSRASGLLSSVRRKVADSLNLPKRRSLILPSRTSEMLDLSQQCLASLQTGSKGGLVGWSQLDGVLGNEVGIHIAGDGCLVSPRTRSWRSVRGKQQERVKLVSASPLKSSPTPSVDDSVLAGDMFISIPGRLSWTRRWCALRSSYLEIYASVLASSSPSPSSSADSVIGSSHLPPLLLSLPLQPGVVEVSPASDKRHPSAVRLSAPALSPHSLLIDAGDTVIMGRWIRGIIEALGHIRPNRVDTVASSSNRHSEIINPPPPPEPIYDEVASVSMNANLSKRWTWTSSPVAYRSVVMEVTPLPTLPSAGPSSPTSSSLNGGNTGGGGGGIYSSIYYDSVVSVDSVEEVDSEEADNESSDIRRNPSSLHSRTTHEMLSRSFSSLQVASASDESMGYSNYLIGNREDLSGGLRLRRYRSLDWHFTARSLQGEEAALPRTACCSSDDKVTSFLQKSSVATPTAEVAVARSYSCAEQSKTSEKIEEGVSSPPRGLTIPLGHVGALPHDPPPIEEVLEHKPVVEFKESELSDGIEEALTALEAVTNATYPHTTSPPTSQLSTASPNLAQRNSTCQQRGPSKRRRNNRRRN
ncbi:hypothetical protein Aperf_G00000122209 [Anoplocephala perfoliata]